MLLRGNGQSAARRELHRPARRTRSRRRGIALKRATIGYAIYMLVGALCVIGLAIYVQNWIGILIGLLLILGAVGFYLVERRSQLPPSSR